MLTNGTLKGCSFDNQASWAANVIDPSTTSLNAEEVMIQGEQAGPTYVQRLSSESPLYPHR
jgi:hypothetical protein